MGAVSCQPDEEVAVHASFTTDKEFYDVGDPVVLTNTSTAENALIAICKWELGKGVVSYETTPENISYDQAGEYVIKLTVTSDRGAKKSSFEKTIRVVDNNIRPVADFTWSPEKVVAGEPVQFTDRSTDEDGEVVAWEWKFGTTTSDKQNPEFTFAAPGGYGGLADRDRQQERQEHQDGDHRRGPRRHQPRPALVVPLRRHEGRLCVRARRPRSAPTASMSM